MCLMQNIFKIYVFILLLLLFLFLLFLFLLLLLYGIVLLLFFQLSHARTPHTTSPYGLRLLFKERLWTVTCMLSKGSHLDNNFHEFSLSDRLRFLHCALSCLSFSTTRPFDSRARCNCSHVCKKRAVSHALGQMLAGSCTYSAQMQSAWRIAASRLHLWRFSLSLSLSIPYIYIYIYI